MKEFRALSLTEHQFAQLMGKESRDYISIYKSRKVDLVLISFNDSQFNTMAKDYYEDDIGFCKDKRGNINLWNVYNLLQTNKSSYIDTWET